MDHGLPRCNSSNQRLRRPWICGGRVLGKYLETVSNRHLHDRWYNPRFVPFTIISNNLLTRYAVCGGGPKNGIYSEYWGARLWYDPGAFKNGFKGVCSVFVTAAFAFSGTELVGLAAAESENPARALPGAIKQVFWRITLLVSRYSQVVSSPSTNVIQILHRRSHVCGIVGQVRTDSMAFSYPS